MELQKYKIFLREVMEASNEFTPVIPKDQKSDKMEYDITALINKQEKLKAQKKSYEDKLTELDEQRKEMQRKFTETKKELEYEIEALNSKIYELQGEDRKSVV